MSSARLEILDRVARALDGVASNVATEFEGDIPRQYRRATDLADGGPEVIEILIDRLEDYRAVVHRAASEAELPQVVATVLADCTSVVVPNGLDPAWLTALPQGTAQHTDSHAEPLGVLELDEIDAVLTACRIAVADSGTIILDGEPDQGRRAITLVPDTHVCVVRTDQVVHILPQAIDVLGQNPLRPQTWISGPSATSDIELNRVEGVHGPRNLHVIIMG